MRRVEFGRVVQLLEDQRERLGRRLASDRTVDDLEAIREVSLAIATLRLCQRHQLSPRSEVRELPITFNGLADYGIVELDENDAIVRPHLVDGEPLRVPPLTLIIQPES